jgi:hypothetical protein
MQPLPTRFAVERGEYNGFHIHRFHLDPNMSNAGRPWLKERGGMELRPQCSLS